MLKGYLVKGMIVMLLLLMVIGGRVFYLQRKHFMDAEKGYIKADWKLAMREYDRALHFYTPWSPYIQKSAERLWQIGEMFEQQEKPDWAVIAYSSIRSSFYASRSFYTPGKDWIAKCDDKIAGLNVKMLINEGSLKPEEADAEREKFLYVMKVNRAPSVGWSIGAEVGFIGWVVSIVFLIFKGFDNNGKPKTKFIVYGFSSFILTFALWVVSLLRA
jgi:hypothetical protein